MNTGYLLLFVGLLGFSLLGILHKVADHPQCRPRMIALILLFWGGVLTTIYTAAFSEKGMSFPQPVIWIGAAGGAMASLALFAFQSGLKHGKISTSWLLLNLATSVPVVLSIFLFGEKLNWGKGIGLILALAALLMMWSDKKLEEAQAAGTETASTGTGSRSKWLPLMLLAFVLQGLAAASQKTLVEAGAGDYVWQFYVVLYWTGFAVMTLLSIRREALPTRREFATALAMAMCSVLGNISITSAMNSVKGVVAYPVSNGGSLTLVALAGVLFFREKIHPIGIAGIACGIGAILVLVMT